MYLKTKASSQNFIKKKFAFSSLILFVVIVYLSSIGGPQPEAGTSPAALAGPALALWILVFWAYRADKAPAI